MTGPALVWLRNDLRLADNPALEAGVGHEGGLILLYLLEEGEGVRPLGGASRWWLHGSLTALAADVEQRGGRLLLRRGTAAEVIPALVAEHGVGAVFWNRRYGPAKDRDAELKTLLKEQGTEVASFAANLLYEPWEVVTGQGEPYKVFTPFWRACLASPPPRGPHPAPERLASIRIDGDGLDDWALLPTQPDWAEGLRETWTPGEASAEERLEEFVQERLEDYHRRDEPAVEATSGLSPHLRFGEISPHRIWQRLDEALPPETSANRAKFLSELGWREFNHHLLFHRPEITERNYRPEFDAFPWRRPAAAELEAWQRGRTGIPLVDAGMRELWRTGVMHNRVRMVAASFLIKNLRYDWRIGEAWFWDTLVDADEASNPGNWQWVAGSGADAAPYFRVFNPVLQQQKFDGQGRYVRHWVADYGTEAYPEPIVDLGESRRAALEAYETVKRRA